MKVLATLYAEDDELLREAAVAIASFALTADSPSRVEALRTLDIDLATVSTQLWETLVVFGGIKSSLQSIEILIKLLRQKGSKKAEAKLELLGPNGSKLVLSGSMTPAELKKQLKEYRAILKKLSMENTDPNDDSDDPDWELEGESEGSDNPVETGDGE